MRDNQLFDSTSEVTVSRDMRAQLGVAEAQRAQLLVLSGAPLGRRVVLDEEPVTIGRGTSCKLILEADSVSRQHAEVVKKDGAYRLLDLGSTNGTFVNELRVVDHELKDGDQIYIGKAQLKYVANGNIEGHYHEEFERLTQRDALTDAYNKRTFEEKVRFALAAAALQGNPVSLIVFDLDHFKQLNDTYGHEAGDRVLQQVAEVVRNVLLNTADLFGRVGGEEFAVLVECDAMAAHSLAARIRHGIEKATYSFGNHTLSATVSVGVASRATQASESVEALYERADDRLYEAKRSGRNCVR